MGQPFLRGFQIVNQIHHKRVPQNTWCSLHGGLMGIGHGHSASGTGIWDPWVSSSRKRQPLWMVRNGLCLNGFTKGAKGLDNQSVSIDWLDRSESIELVESIGLKLLLFQILKVIVVPIVRKDNRCTPLDLWCFERRKRWRYKCGTGLSHNSQAL